MIEKLENLLKQNSELSVLGIRYFSGLELFCTNTGEFKGKTLEESLEKFLQKQLTNSLL